MTQSKKCASEQVRRQTGLRGSTQEPEKEGDCSWVPQRPHGALTPILGTPELVSSLAGLGGSAWACIPGVRAWQGWPRGACGRAGDR